MIHAGQALKGQKEQQHPDHIDKWPEQRGGHHPLLAAFIIAGAEWNESQSGPISRTRWPHAPWKVPREQVELSSCRSCRWFDAKGQPRPTPTGLAVKKTRAHGIAQQPEARIPRGCAIQEPFARRIVPRAGHQHRRVSRAAPLQALTAQGGAS